MGKYYVKTTVEFSGEVFADTAEEAEAMGWKWEDELMFDGVYSIDVEELESDEDDDES
jgi:hypothetical protein